MLGHRQHKVPPDSDAVDKEHLQLHRDNRKVQHLYQRPDLVVRDERRRKRFLHLADTILDPVCGWVR